MTDTIIVENGQVLETNTYANRALVPLAVEAGILPVINSLTPLAMTEGALLYALKQALASTNPPLAAALTTQTLAEIMEYAATVNNAVAPATELPDVLNLDGPASVSAARDGGLNTQVNVTFSGQPVGFEYEIYLDGVFQKRAGLAPSAGFTNEAIQNVAAGAHTIRVLYVRVSDGAISRFGQLANILS